MAAFDQDASETLLIEAMCGPKELSARRGRDVHPLEARRCDGERALDPRKAVKQYRRLVTDVQEVRSLPALQHTWQHLVQVCRSAAVSDFTSYGAFLQDRLRAVRVDLTLNRAVETAPAACALLYLRCALAQAMLSYSLRALFERTTTEAFHFEGNRQDVQQAAQSAARAAKIAIAAMRREAAGSAEIAKVAHVLDASSAVALMSAAAMPETRLLSAVCGNAPDGDDERWIQASCAKMAEFYLSEFEVLSETVAAESLKDLVTHGIGVRGSHLLLAIGMIRSVHRGDLYEFWRLWSKRWDSVEDLPESPKNVHLALRSLALPLLRRLRVMTLRRCTKHFMKNAPLSGAFLSQRLRFVEGDESCSTTPRARGECGEGSEKEDVERTREALLFGKAFGVPAMASTASDAPDSAGTLEALQVHKAELRWSALALISESKVFERSLAVRWLLGRDRSVLGRSDSLAGAEGALLPGLQTAGLQRGEQA